MPVTTAGQDINPIPTPVGDVSVGDTFLRDFSDFPGDMNFPAGWYASAGVNLTRWFGLVGEFGASYKNDFRITDAALGDEASRILRDSFTNDARVYTALGGPRFAFRSGRVAPFVQVLAGGIQLRTKTTAVTPVAGFDPFRTRENYFALQPGGGLTIYVSQHVGLRVQADHRLIVDFDEDGNEYDNEFRAAAGFVFGWGRR